VSDRTRTTALLLSALCLALFCAIAYSALAGGALAQLDQWALAQAALFHATPLTPIMRGITNLGGTLFVLTAGCGAAACCRARQLRAEAAGLLAAVLGGVVLHSLLKALFQRPRPAGLLAAHGWSFPSGHAMDSVLLYGMLACVLLPRLRSRAAQAAIAAAAAAAVLAVGCSRLYLQVHYASDVLAGWAAGLCWLAACRAGMAYCKGRKQERH
jgi:undecaprenyl-diphosphatase